MAHRVWQRQDTQLSSSTLVPHVISRQLFSQYWARRVIIGGADLFDNLGGSYYNEPIFTRLRRKLRLFSRRGVCSGVILQSPWRRRTRVGEVSPKI